MDMLNRIYVIYLSEQKRLAAKLKEDAWEGKWPIVPISRFLFCLFVCLFIFRFLDSAASLLCLCSCCFFLFFQLATPFYHRTSQKWIPTIFFFQFFTSCDWTSHRAHSASDLCSLIFMFILCPCLCAIGRASTQATCFYVFNFLTTVCSEPLSRNYSFFLIDLTQINPPVKVREA